MQREMGAGAAVGAILVAVAIGVFLLEATNFTLEPHDVTWYTQQTNQSFEGTLAEGQVITHVLTVPGQNTTALNFVLTWQDDTGAPDRFRITVNGPNGSAFESKTIEGTSGNIAVYYNPIDGLPAPPPPTQVRAADTGHAVTEAGGARQAWPEGVVWRVTIHLESAPGSPASPLPPPLGSPAVQDGQNGYALTLTRTMYEAQAQRV